MNDECEWKNKIQYNYGITCKYCNSTVLRKNIEKYYDICDEFPIKCTINGCNEFIKRKDLNEHITINCNYIILDVM